MSKTVVVYHSGYGHTQRVAQFVAEGASAQLIDIDANGDLTEAQWADLDAADAIIMGSPTYMGMASWQFKKFADATSKKMVYQRLERQNRRRLHLLSRIERRQALNLAILHHLVNATRHDLGGTTYDRPRQRRQRDQPHQLLQRRYGPSRPERSSRQNPARRFGYGQSLR